MVDASEPDIAEDIDSQADLGPSTLDGEPVRALAIVTAHHDKTAVWWVSLAGEPCGAWVLSSDSKDAAIQIVSLCDRRALVMESSATLLTSIAETAEISVAEGALSGRIASLASLLDATRQARELYVQEVDATGKAKASRLAPLVWPRAIPKSLGDLRKSVAGVRQVEREGLPEALALARMTQRAIKLWTETESVRMRRPYLPDKFGPAQLLPTEWRDPIRSAYSQSFFGS